jgi:hypothetical protein
VVSKESDTLAALRRAGKRAIYHLAMAGVEGLKALQAVVDELANIDRDDPEGGVQRIEVE